MSWLHISFFKLKILKTFYIHCHICQDFRNIDLKVSDFLELFVASPMVLPLKLSGLAEADDYLFNCAVTVMQPISQHKWVSATLGWAEFKSQRKALREAEEAHISLRIKCTSPSISWVVHSLGFCEDPLNQTLLGNT